MKTWFRVLNGLACVLVLPAISHADVKLHPLFTDHMVLQQGIPLNVWGTAAPEESITVKLEKKGAPEVSATAKADKEGKWKVTLPAQKAEAGVVATLTAKGNNEIVLKDVAIGEVWICSGQSNMEWPVNASTKAEENKKKSANPDLRLFTVPKKTDLEPQTTVVGKWSIAGPDTIGVFSAVGYYFGRDLQAAIKVPVGLIHTSWGGTPAEAWTSKEGLESSPELKNYVDSLKSTVEQRKKFDPEKAKKDHEAAVAKWKEDVEKAKADKKPAPKGPPGMAQAPGGGSGTPTVLYNAMIAPLVNFGIKGAIWYQGESNAGAAWKYRTLFPTMIQDWRKAWNQGDFPFLFVQLAPFQKPDSEPVDHPWAVLREAQLYTMQSVKNTGMAVITDHGEADIHPKAKEPVGVRLALIARGTVYGEKVEPYGPLYKSKKIEDNKIILSFDHVGGGLVTKGEKLTGFAICGEDKKFVWADAVIQGETVVVSSAKVEKPVAVRFGWQIFPVVNLFNKDGEPATPFRTDDFPVATRPASPKK